MDFLWWLDAPFWQKLYAMGMIGGITFFISELFVIFDGWNVKLRDFFNDCMRNYRDDIRKWRH